MTNQQLDLTTDRKRFHRSIDQFDTEVCQHCGKPLTMIADPLIGVEWVCENRLCPGR